MGTCYTPWQGSTAAKNPGTSHPKFESNGVYSPIYCILLLILCFILFFLLLILLLVLLKLVLPLLCLLRLLFLFSRVHATLYVTMSVGRSVGPSVITSRFWAFRAERRAYLSCCPCPDVILPLPTHMMSYIQPYLTLPCVV